MTGVVLAIILSAVGLLVFVLAVIGLVSVLDLWESVPFARVDRERRTAERRIDHIARQTEARMMAEVIRRARPTSVRGDVIDGEWHY